MPTIITQIEDTEGKIKQCEERLDDIERMLRLSNLTDSQRQTLHIEEKQLKESLSNHEKELGNLRKENGKTMFVSVILLALIYAGYCFLYPGS